MHEKSYLNGRIVAIISLYGIPIGQKARGQITTEKYVRSRQGELQEVVIGRKSIFMGT
jgi:hypothetical protein